MYSGTNTRARHTSMCPFRDSNRYRWLCSPKKTHDSSKIKTLKTSSFS